MKDLYEQNEIWKKYRKDVDERIQTYYREAVALILSDVESILDIGCEEGSFLNMLGDKWSVIGLDRSKTVLKYVRGKGFTVERAICPLRIKASI